LGRIRFRRRRGGTQRILHRPKRLGVPIDLHRSADTGVVKRTPGQRLNNVLVLSGSWDGFRLKLHLRESKGVVVAGAILHSEENPGRGVAHEFVVHPVAREVHRKATGDVALPERDVLGRVVADGRNSAQVVGDGERQVLDVDTRQGRQGQAFLNGSDVPHAVDDIGRGGSGVRGRKSGLLKLREATHEVKGSGCDGTSGQVDGEVRADHPFVNEILALIQHRLFNRIGLTGNAVFNDVVGPGRKKGSFDKGVEGLGRKLELDPAAVLAVDLDNVSQVTVGPDFGTRDGFDFVIQGIGGHPKDLHGWGSWGCAPNLFFDKRELYSIRIRHLKISCVLKSFVSVEFCRHAG